MESDDDNGNPEAKQTPSTKAPEYGKQSDYKFYKAELLLVMTWFSLLSDVGISVIFCFCKLWNILFGEIGPRKYCHRIFTHIVDGLFF